MTVLHELAALVAGIEASEGATEFSIAGASDPEEAQSALGRALAHVSRVRHPEEPNDPFLSYVSEISRSGGRVSFWADTADVSAYPGVPEALAAAVIAGVEEEPDADGVLIAGVRAALVEPQLLPPSLHPVPPEWFPLPPGAQHRDSDRPLEESFQFLNGTVEGGFIKCWTPMEPAALVAFYEDVLTARGFALSEVTSEVVRMGLRWRRIVATFTRDDQAVEIEAQAAKLLDDTSADAAAEVQTSRYASLTETWLRLRNLAEAAEFQWRDRRWVRATR